MSLSQRKLLIEPGLFLRAAGRLAEGNLIFQMRLSLRR